MDLVKQQTIKPCDLENLIHAENEQPEAPKSTLAERLTKDFA